LYVIVTDPIEREIRPTDTILRESDQRRQNPLHRP